MPCDTITTTTVDAGKMAPALVVAALETLGARAIRTTGVTVSWIGGTYDAAAGRLTTESAAWNAAEIKRAYSAEVVKSQARRFGWTLKQTAPYTFQVSKR